MRLGPKQKLALQLLQRHSMSETALETAGIHRAVLKGLLEKALIRQEKRWKAIDLYSEIPLQPEQIALTEEQQAAYEALMPAIGYVLGRQFESLITSVDHWIAFVLLAWIGGNMIRESRAGDKEDEEQPSNGEVRHKELLVLAVATSIDALAVGVTFSMVELSVSIGLAVALIGCTTFLISLGGVYVGNVFGARYKSRAELVGGAILILIGVKVLLEHLLG